MANEKKIPQSEEPTNLRSYIGKVELSKDGLNEREKEMLNNLSICASELSTFHQAYSAMGRLVGALSKLLVCFGILQLLAIGSVYIKSKTQLAGVDNA
ncbi:hypothetical protein [Coraliomargarita parva]|uniref:hypothetical protein n=1 Tax=Coraliomargarita parva TaxID=3014050 RepID=UPI0022B36BD9|nr:hypothetical protein [Coraliomargarita parva]